MKYEVWQTGSVARISTHTGVVGAARACQKAVAKFRRSRDYNPGSLIGFEVRRSDGAPLTDEERAQVERIDEEAHFSTR